MQSRKKERNPKERSFYLINIYSWEIWGRNFTKDPYSLYLKGKWTFERTNSLLKRVRRANGGYATYFLAQKRMLNTKNCQFKFKNRFLKLWHFLNTLVFRKYHHIFGLLKDSIFNDNKGILLSLCKTRFFSLLNYNFVFFKDFPLCYSNILCLNCLIFVYI